MSSCPPAIHEILDNCWDENPNLRHSFTKIRDLLTKNLGRMGDNIIDYLIESMEKHAAALELEADNKMKMLEEEKQRSDDILSHMLPKTIAHALSHGIHPPPEVFESTTVQFSAVDGFSKLASGAKTPHNIIRILNALYTTCDFAIENYDVYKVETVKDAYMIVSGLPVRNGIRHADNIASLAFHMRRNVSLMELPVEILTDDSTKLRLRVGIHSGPCVAAIVGTRLPRYCL
ncbi:hypothetical protein RvY_13214 [Ramazzottius varieornatus]|uniref:guanylate cyclase n=1 Tax=Ramazzottius varieornatus TaxID=947166 RepID=A0A1D1VSH6_RAMVA|nr:hypothetical protein RvY_13214 [Ramazzottius varieornatus]